VTLTYTHIVAKTTWKTQEEVLSNRCTHSHTGWDRYHNLLILLIPILLVCSATDTNTRNYLITTVDDWYKGLFGGMYVVHMHWVVYW